MGMRRLACVLCVQALYCLLQVHNGYGQSQASSKVLDMQVNNAAGVKNEPMLLANTVPVTDKAKHVDKTVAQQGSVTPPDKPMAPIDSVKTNNKPAKIDPLNVAMDNILLPAEEKLILSPASKVSTKGVKSLKPATPPKNMLQDTIVMSDFANQGPIAELRFNDMFPHKASVQQQIQQPANTQVMPARQLFDRSTAQFPESSLRFTGKPEAPNPLVRFITVGNTHAKELPRKLNKKKSAILLSDHSPFYSGSRRIQFHNWMDLNPYKTGTYKNSFYKDIFAANPYPNTGRNIKTLLEAGSVASFVNQFEHFTRSQDPLTQTTGYPSLLDTLFQDMDMTVDPCDDFYQFACGGYVANATRKNGMINRPEEAKDQVVKTVKWVLDQVVTPADPEVLVKGKQFYHSCMNEQVVEERGLTPVRNFLSDRGGWPVLGLWDPRRFDLVDLLAQNRPLLGDRSMHQLPTGAIIGTTIQRDFKNPGTHAVYFDQPSLGQLNLGGMPNNEIYKLGKDIVYNKAYEDYLVDIAVALGANPDVARRDMCDVVLFERALSDIMLPEEERRLVETRYRRVSLLQMSLMHPYFNWLRYIESLLQGEGSSVSVKLSNKVVLWASPYFNKLGKVLSKTPKRVLANYALLRAIQPMLPATNRLMQLIQLRYTAVANGAERPNLPLRSQFCGQVVVDNMSWLASRIFVESSLGKQVAEQTVMIQDHVKKTFLQLIERATWMDRRTKRAQLAKVRAIEDRMLLPVGLLNDKMLNGYYAELNITENFFENMEMTLRHGYTKSLKKLLAMPVEDWIVRPTEVRAVYNAGANAVEIPAAFVQPPYIDLSYSPAMNFGGIGTVIANAYAHAYDVAGVKFDGKGQIKRQMSAQAIYQYGVRANCFVNQYSNYYLPDVNLPVVNGNKTLTGNLPDNIALETAFYAFKAWKADIQVPENYEVLFTGEQLYFINYARTMCQSATPTYTRKLPYSSSFSVPRLRVIGPLQNSREFATAFQCPVDSHMNPRDKCSFWS